MEPLDHGAFITHDTEALAGCVTEDCTFEDTTPPDGARHIGAGGRAHRIRAFLRRSPNAHFDVEEHFTTGDRALVLWRYSWADGHVHGADVMRVRDGRVAESLAYVKG